MANFQIGNPTGTLFGQVSPGTTGVGTFSNNPTPTSGQGSQGLVPGQVANPIPNASTLNTTAGNDLLSKLSGTLSPGTQNALQNASAEWGISSGMGDGSGIGWNQLYGNIANASENQQQQGLTDYNQITGPSFQTNLAQNNANLAAAPDPSASASYAQQLYNEYLQQMQRSKSPAGGTGSATSSGVPPTPFDTSAQTSGFPNNPPDGAPADPFAGLTATTSNGLPSYSDWSNPSQSIDLNAAPSFADTTNDFLNFAY